MSELNDGNKEVAIFQSNFLSNNKFMEVLGSVSEFEVLTLNKVYKYKTIHSL